MSTETELMTELSTSPDFITGTIGLYEGRLVKTETDLYFIAEKFQGWEIMEECALSDVQKVEVTRTFMGAVVEVHTTGSHWSIKDIDEQIDVGGWIHGQPASVTESTPPTSAASSFSVSPTLPTTENTASDSSLQSAISHMDPESNEVVDDVNPRSASPNAAEPTTSINNPSAYPDSTNPMVNELRQILIDRPEFQDQVRRSLGSSVDPLQEEVLLLFMRRHLPAYLSIKVASGKVIMPFEILSTLRNLLGADGTGNTVVKVFKYFMAVWVALFVLPIAIAMMTFLFQMAKVLLDL